MAWCLTGHLPAAVYVLFHGLLLISLLSSFIFAGKPPALQEDSLSLRNPGIK
jgi:hypothetical protein